jgi:hypothetical protein
METFASFIGMSPKNLPFWDEKKFSLYRLRGHFSEGELLLLGSIPSGVVQRDDEEIYYPDRRIESRKLS